MDDIKDSKYSLNLIENYNKKKISERQFDDIVEYGFLNNDEIYYIGLNYMSYKLRDSSGYLVYIGDKYLGNYVNISPQSKKYGYRYIKTGSDGSYAFVANEILDTVKLELAAYVFTNKGKLLFVSTIETDKKGFDNISNLMYIKENRLFFTGMFNYEDTYIIEILIDNKPIGKTYNSISYIEYDEDEDEITFFGVRDEKIYSVAIQF